MIADDCYHSANAWCVINSNTHNHSWRKLLLPSGYKWEKWDKNKKKKMKHLHNVTQVEYFKTRIQIWELKI